MSPLQSLRPIIHRRRIQTSPINQPRTSGGPNINNSSRGLRSNSNLVLLRFHTVDTGKLAHDLTTANIHQLHGTCGCRWSFERKRQRRVGTVRSEGAGKGDRFKLVVVLMVHFDGFDEERSR